MLYRAREQKLHLSGVQMDYITFGRGATPLIMIQGLSTRDIRGSAVPLAYMYRIFAREFKVYLFDRRADVPEGITVRELAADIAGAMDALGLTKAAVLGVSQGGMIAQYLAIERPDLVDKLVLAVTLSKNNDTVKAVVSRWTDLAERGDMKELVGDMAEKLYSAGYRKRYQRLMPLLTVLQKPKDVRRFVRLAEACLTCSTYEALDKIRCPVLVLGARQDQVVTGAASEEMAEKLGCKIHMYDNLGHAAYEEAKDFNRLVYEFLAG